ncbi:hypothetical protein E1B28_007264 [Marasmius oreades]|uniref:Uncharacterized protein n=1 Tax=Marasmius oreades TaxID=181124 RepID=A0A9P7S301_9AGAR|nr:uncharacterized protein E1B28_007264 [Marasmius oreades]KAG7093598.1 hypothetical protein E1B28_007264 [Marasmius oreades]
MLPTELCQEIISTLWASPLSPSERAAFIKSSLLVSRTWNAIFTRVSSRDVHILSSSHGLQFIDLLLGNTRTFHLQLLDQLCHSITIQHSNKALLPGPENEKDQPLGLVIYAILDIIFMSPDRLPSLRRISFNLENYLMETIFTRNKFLYLPPQIEELEFGFSYSDDTDPLVIQAIKSRSYELFDIPPHSMTHIRKLRVLGTSSGVAKELLEACGGYSNLELFEQDAWKDASVTKTWQTPVFSTSESSSSPSINSPPLVLDGDELQADNEKADTWNLDSESKNADGATLVDDSSAIEEAHWPVHKENMRVRNFFSKSILRRVLRVFRRRQQAQD